MNEHASEHPRPPVAPRPGPRAVLWLGLRILLWAVVLALDFAAGLWLIIVTAPKGGGAVIGAPLVAMLGPLLLSVPWALVRGWREGHRVETYAFWPAAYLLAALLGTPVLVWNNGWFTPGALPPGQALRDIAGTVVFLSVLALLASAVVAGAAAAAAATARWVRRRHATSQAHP